MTTFAYAAAGRLLAATDSLGGTILNSYDALNRLVAQATGLGTISYQYDALGRRTRMDAPGPAPVFYGYDAASRLRTITQAPLNPVTIDYDALGRRTLLTLPNGVSTQYQYDNASRLTALNYRNAVGLLGDLSYQYDVAGNRIRVGGSFARTLLPDPVPSATYDPANRQLAFGDKQLTYDATGNLASLTDPFGLTTFAWDARNRLVGLGGSGVTASLTYDSLARRNAKTINGQLTQFIYDGLDIAQQLDSLGTTSYLRSLEIDETFSFTNRNGTDFSIYDPLGSTLAVTDQTSNPVVQYTYEPFGRTSSTDPSFPNPFQFTGRENDATGLYYYRARYYHPGLQRFISEDPLRASLNVYTYVGNSPLLASDPFGLFTVVVRGGFGEGPIGPSGSGRGGMEQIAAQLRGIGQEVVVLGPGEAAAALAQLRAHQGDPTGAHVVCHSRGCDHMLSQLNQHQDVRVDRLVTLDCFGFSGACGVIPSNAATNLNYWQARGLLHGSPNRRGTGGAEGITNIQRPESHTGIPGAEAVQRGIVACIGSGVCSGAGALGGRK